MDHDYSVVKSLKGGAIAVTRGDEVTMRVAFAEATRDETVVMATLQQPDGKVLKRYENVT